MTLRPSTTPAEGESTTLDLGAIVPRWEWRTFGTQFRSAETTIASLRIVETKASVELYLVVPSGVNAKVRNGVLDVKELLEIDADGLERWTPILQRPFPLRRDDVADAFDVFGLPRPETLRESYTLDELLDELVEPNQLVRTVEVRKHRDLFEVSGCRGERSEVLVDGVPIRTIAVESEDASAVGRAVHDLGLGGYRNVNYPRWLRRVLERAPVRFAVVDVGTTSVKFHVGEVAPDGSWSTVVDRAEVTRLGERLAESGSIAPEALERTSAAIVGMVDETEERGALAVAAVGTAGLRRAANRSKVVEAIRERSGLTIDVISGEDEARLAFRAVQAGLGVGSGSLAVFDTGGGSTELTFGEGDRVIERFSVEVGALRYTERYGLDTAVPAEVLAAALAAISDDLSRLDGREVPDRLVGMGGAITNITAVSKSLRTYDPDAVQGAVVTRDEVDRQIELYRSMDAPERRSIVGLQPKRAEVILAGACIIRTVMNKLGHESLTVSDRGLRHGLIIDRFGSSEAS